MEDIYRHALYKVEAERPFVLMDGQYSDALSSLLKSEYCHSAAFLTAYNPRSVKKPSTVNEYAQSKLEEQIRFIGCKTIPAVGEDPDPSSTWQGERSVLALGISLHDSVRLGFEFDQNAIIWCPETAIPRLLMLPY